ncbi:MAG TPA: hypothetical protein VIG97_12080 [Luteimonas sp.]
MKRYPLQTLVRLREHRTEAARQRVLERQREAQACRDACLALEGEIIALEFEQKQHRGRMLDPPPPGVPWPNALAQREAHVDLLGEQAEAARQRLFKAQETLRAAEAAVAEARADFFRAKARLDALEKRRDVWDGEQSMLEARQEEGAAEDLLQARHLAGG